MYKSIFTGILILLVCYALALPGEPDYNLSEETDLYGKIAAVELNTREGKTNIAELYTRSPLILAFVYTRCSGICSPFLLQLTENIQQLSENREYTVVVISLDPADSLQDMRRLAKHFKVENNNRWVFGVTGQIDTLIRSIGLKVVWDSVTNQYDHEALLAGVNRDGYIVKKLTGLRSPKDIALLIKEINGTYIPSYPLPGRETLFSCFTYDPATQTNKPALGLLLLVSPVVLTSAVIASLAFRRHRRASV